MKASKAKSLRELGADELKAKIKDQREGLFKLRIRKEARQLENPVSLRHARREIARLATVLAEKTKAASPK
ncbi:MAG: 50S ribosomal protein L29 [candidate division FCPU426 bacterium]